MSQHLRAVYEEGVFRPLEPVYLPEHQEVLLVLEGPMEPVASTPVDKPIWEIAAELVHDIPEDVVNAVPTDGAAHHDHYLYGSPRRD